MTADEITVNGKRKAKGEPRNRVEAAERRLRELSVSTVKEVSRLRQLRDAAENARIASYANVPSYFVIEKLSHIDETIVQIDISLAKLLSEYDEAIAKQRERKKSSQPRNQIGYVYLIHALFHDGNRYYKIGKTNNLDDRLHTFNVKLPVYPEYIHTIQTARYSQLEKELHRKFKAKRVEKTEWFDLNDDDITYIKSISSDMYSKYEKARGIKMTALPSPVELSTMRKPKTLDLSWKEIKVKNWKDDTLHRLSGELKLYGDKLLSGESILLFYSLLRSGVALENAQMWRDYKELLLIEFAEAGYKAEFIEVPQTNKSPCSDTHLLTLESIAPADNRWIKVSLS